MFGLLMQASRHAAGRGPVYLRAETCTSRALPSERVRAPSPHLAPSRDHLYRGGPFRGQRTRKCPLWVESGRRHRALVDQPRVERGPHGIDAPPVTSNRGCGVAANPSSRQALVWKREHGRTWARYRSSITVPSGKRITLPSSSSSQCIGALWQKDAVPLASMTARPPVREFAGSRHLDTS